MKQAIRYHSGVKKIDTLDTLKKGSMFPALQGLRGIAVLLVILSHSNFAFSINGFVGVDIFFVVSGFLITRRMIEEYISNRKASGRQGWISFVGFYVRRARKIIPAALFVILATLLASIFLTPLTGPYVNVASDATWALFFLANLNFMSQSVTYFGVPTSQSPYLHYWSLSVEEQFYMLWPVLFLTATSFGGFKAGTLVFNWRRRLQLVLFVLGTMSLAIYILQNLDGNASSYYSSIGRFWEFSVGSLFATRKGVISFRFLSPLCFFSFLTLVVAFLLCDGESFRYWIPLLTVLTGLLLNRIVEGGKVPFSPVLFENKPIIYLGKISYSLYLVHFPVIVFLENSGFKTNGFNFLLYFPAVLLLGTFVYYEIESRFMKMKVLETSIRSASRRTRYFPLNKRAIRYSCVGILSLIFVFNFQIGNTVPVYNAIFSPNVFEPWSAPDPTNSSSATDLSPGASSSGGTQPSLLNSWQKKVALSIGLSDVPEGMRATSGLDAEKTAIWQNCLVIVGDNPLCNSGPANAENKIYIYGDSYALSLKPMIMDAVRSQNNIVYSRIRGMCMVPEVKLTSQDLEKACASHRKEMLRDIEKTRPNLIIASSQNSAPISGTKQELYNGMVTAYENLVKNATQVIIIGETPYGRDPRVCPGASKSLKNCSGSTINRSEYRELTKKAAIEAGAFYIDITPWICVEGKCPVLIDGKWSTYDGGHLTSDLSSRLAPVFKEKLLQMGILKED